MNIIISIAPFKVFCSVISLVFVYVINFWIIVGIWFKSFCHKAVNHKCLHLIVFTETNF